MTRINLVPPKELTDQHLMAEYREMPMVPSALRRSLRTKTINEVLFNIPRTFTLNAGHVRFFYNKLSYLQLRFIDVKHELLNRGYLLDKDRVLGIHSIPFVFFGDYQPTDEAYSLIRSRIAEKISMKPLWYKKYGKPIHL